MTDTERKRIDAICEVAGVKEIDDLSDGFHTFRQLYYQRMMLFATIVKQNKDRAWKSLRHEDGELCFGGGWFIVGIDTPEGSYTYHYENNYFSLFDCEELERGKHWDGHTEKDVTRLLSLSAGEDANVPSNDTISRKMAIDAIEFGITYAKAINKETGEVVELFAESNDELRKAVDRIKALPSAQPEPIRINLNEPIKVKLTDRGKEIYYHQYDRTNKIAGKEICKPKFPKEDENGYTEFQLWCFMKLYGECMGMTLPNVIKPLEIVYER